jgi:hypothetical protein
VGEELEPLSEFVMDTSCSDPHHRYKPSTRYAEEKLWYCREGIDNNFTPAGLYKNLASQP